MAADIPATCSCQCLPLLHALCFLHADCTLHRVRLEADTAARLPLQMGGPQEVLSGEVQAGW